MGEVLGAEVILAAYLLVAFGFVFFTARGSGGIRYLVREDHFGLALLGGYTVVVFGSLLGLYWLTTANMVG